MDLKYTKIAISGKKNSGKNEIALALNSLLFYFDEKLQIVAFADPLKRIVQTICPSIDHNILWSESRYRDQKLPLFDKSSDDYITCRSFLKNISNYICEYNKSILIDIVDYKLRNTAFDCFIVTDVRKKDELKWAKDNNFFLIRVIRSSNSNDDKDITETDLDDVDDSEFDYIIYNNGDLNYLYNEVEYLVNDFLIKKE